MEESINLKNSGEQLVAAGPAGCLPAEEFLWESYRLRRNVLSGKVEYRLITEDDSQFRPLTDADVKSMILKSRREGYVDKYDISKDLKLLVDSADIPVYNPIEEYLKGLEWDGKDRVVDLWKRIPGITAEQIYFCAIWMRGMVAQWLHLNTEHGNECVPTLVGGQGEGKTTFFQRLLPQQFRKDYFLPGINLSNKFDKNMALSNNLLVNMDELDKYTKSQQANIKQLLSTVSVNGRKIYGRAQDNQPRYASFTATTNVSHPLVDTTGSRRHLCVHVQEGQYIDNITPIEHEQLYAQLVYEVKEKQERYWFTNEETERIQQLNLPFMQIDGFDKMIELSVAPLTDESSEQCVTTAEIIANVKKNFPEANISKLSPIKVGRVMKALGYSKKHLTQREVYIATLRQTA